MTTGIRPATISTVSSAIFNRSSTVSVQTSDAITGATMPGAPASTQNSICDRRLSRSSAPDSVKGVQGIVKTPRHDCRFFTFVSSNDLDAAGPGPMMTNSSVRQHSPGLRILQLLRKSHQACLIGLVTLSVEHSARDEKRRTGSVDRSTLPVLLSLGQQSIPTIHY